MIGNRRGPQLREREHMAVAGVRLSLPLQMTSGRESGQKECEPCRDHPKVVTKKGVATGWIQKSHRYYGQQDGARDESLHCSLLEAIAA